MADYENSVGIQLETDFDKAIRYAQQLSTQLNSLNSMVSSMTQRINSLTKSLNSLNNTNLKNLSSQMQNLMNTFNRFSNLNVSGLTGQADQLKQFLDSLKNVDLSIIKQLQQLPKTMESISAIDSSKVGEVFSTLATQIQPFIAKLKEASAEIQGLSNITNTVKTFNTNIKNAESNVKSLGNQANKTSNSIKRMFTVGNLIYYFNMSKRIFDMINNSIKSAIDFRETENLFAVAMGNMKQEAMKFQNSLSEVFGLALPDTMQYTATFKNMLSSIEGLAENSSTRLSNILTKMQIDFSSLYNVSIESAGEKLQSALSRQVRPIRSVSGMDITQNVLGASLQQIGIYDRTISQLSEMEKRLVIIYTLQQQMANAGALGDFAKTIEQPAQQLRILQQQIQEVGRWLGAVFESTIGRILPYIVAFTMVIKELIKAFAMLVGYQMPDSSRGENILDMMDDTANDFGTTLGDGIDKAAEKVKNLLAPFDKVNVLTKPEDSSSSGSGSSSSIGGIDYRILDAIQDYDIGLESVSMKATQIRDSIMEWLGFTKQVNAETGEVTWNLKEGWSNLKTIGVVLASIIGLGILSRIAKLITYLKGSNGVIGLVKNLASTISGKLSPVMLSIKNWGLASTIKGLLAQLKLLIPSLSKVSLGIGGITGVVLGSSGAYNAMKNLTVGTEEADKETGKFVISMAAATAGGAALGSVIPGLGTVVGALAGALVGGTAALIGYGDGLEQLAKENLFGTVNIQTSQWKEMLNNLNLSIYDSTSLYDDMTSRITSLADSFKTSAESLDFYGIKFGQLEQQITEEDAVNIKNSIDDMCNSASQIIDESVNYNLQLMSNAFDSYTTLSEDEQKNILQGIYENGQKQQQELSTAQNNITSTYENAISTRGYLTDEERKYIEEQLQAIRDLTANSMSQAQTDMEYYKTLYADTSQALDEESYANLKQAMDEFYAEKLSTIEENYNRERNSLEQQLSSQAITQEDYDAAVLDAYQRRNALTQELDDEMQSYQDDVLGYLKERYKELIDDNTDLGLKQKGIIAQIFKDFDVDTSELEKEFRDAGASAGTTFSGALSRNLSVDGSNLYSTYNRAIDKIVKGSGVSSFGVGGSLLKNNLLSLKVPGYASGGFVPMNAGQLFVANEPGNPELVGNIGGQTAVVNNKMILDGIKSAMKSAIIEGMQLVFSEQPNGDIYVDVYVDGVFTERKMIKENEKHLLKTGKMVFTKG